MNKLISYNKILEYFQGNEVKTNLWFNTPNPGLGNVTPMFMIKVGREKKLEDFIDSCLEGNRP